MTPRRPMGLTRLAALAIVATACACATQEEKRRGYNPIVAGSQAIHLTGYTTRFEATAPPFYQLPGKSVSVPLSDAHCTLHNDKGSWESSLPGEVAVQTGGDLRIECRKAGYKPQSHTIRCTSPKARGAFEGAFGPLLLSPQLTAYGIVFAPAVVLGVMAAGAVVGSEASAAAAGAEGHDACDYQYTAVGIYFWPDEREEEPW